MSAGTITWVDMETNGLDPHENVLLEVACLVTDNDLNILDDDGYQAVVRYTDQQAMRAYQAAVPFVREMHTKTGLWKKLTHGTYLYRIDEELHDYVARFSEPRTSPVGGNSLRLDMNFMDRYLPLTAAHLDYHMRDVSTVAGLAKDWYGLPPFKKVSDHTAMTDIRECVKELRYYREFFTAEAAL